MVPKTTKSLGKQIKSSSTQTRQAAFSLLRHLVQAMDTRIDLTNLVAPLLIALGDSNSNSSVKIEALLFLAAFFQRPGETEQDVMDSLLKPVIASCGDKYYKITVQALVVLDALVKLIGTKESIQAIYGCVIGVLDTADADLEVKGCALTALGSLLYHARAHLDGKEVKERVLPLLVDRLGNELTRLVTLRVLTRIVDGGGLDDIVIPVMNECVVCLRQSQRQVLISALSCLIGFVNAYPKSGGDTYDGILKQGSAMLETNADPAVFCLILTLCTAIIGHAGGGCVEGFKGMYVEKLMKIAMESPHMFSGARVLIEFGHMWRAVVMAGSHVVEGKALVKELVADIKRLAMAGKGGLEKQSFPVVANAVVTVCCFEELGGESIEVPDWIREVQQEIAGAVYQDVCDGGNKKAKVGESEKYLGLLILGEIGQRMYALAF
jgi:hypothetical protein